MFQVWEGVYRPLIEGSYRLRVHWGDLPVDGSPFQVTVIGERDPSKVDVCTEGLKRGIVGQELKTTIDTRVAGPGKTS